MISDYNQSTETITDTFMVDVSSVFGKTEQKLSQQESNFWYPQTWWIDYLTNLKIILARTINTHTNYSGNKLYFYHLLFLDIM